MVKREEKHRNSTLVVLFGEYLLVSLIGQTANQSRKNGKEEKDLSSFPMSNVIMK